MERELVSERILLVLGERIDTQEGADVHVAGNTNLRFLQTRERGCAERALRNKLALDTAVDTPCRLLAGNPHIGGV